MKSPHKVSQLVIIKRTRTRIPQKFLKTWVRNLNRFASTFVDERKYRGRELVVAFVSSQEMRKLNKRYRGKDRATDVLSFESGEPDALGELVIAMDVIAVQAREHGLLVREELGYMIIHGFLHLLGYDHEKSPGAAEKMFNIQDQLFEKLLASRAHSR